MIVEGEMSFSQFYQYLIEIGLNIQKNDASVLFKMIDKDRSSRVTYNEIKKLINYFSNISFPIYSEL